MNNIFQKILLICLIAIGFTNMNARELLNPKSTIIDIGYTKPQKNYDVNVAPDWVYYSSLSKLTDKLIQSKERVLSERFDCEIDYLGRENCSIQQVDCTALLQQDDGIAIKKNKTITFNANTEESTNCSSNSYTSCETEVLLKTIYFTMYYYSTPSGPSDRVWVTSATPIGSPFPSTGNLCGAAKCMAEMVLSKSGIQLNAIVDSIELGNWLMYAWNNYTMTHGPKNIPIQAYVTIYKKHSCPSDFKIKKEGNNYICEKEYSYYEYKCKTDTNNYDRPWIGPVKDTGGDCQGQCGPYGCVCNSPTPPKNNCVRDDFVCPFDENQLCTITTDDKSSKNNIINGFIYENGTAQTFKNTVEKDKSCPNGLTWNKDKDICEDTVKYECLKSDYYYDDNLGECIKPVECKGELNSEGICVEKSIANCPQGYIYDSKINLCVSNPICDKGIYNTTTNLCEEKISCPLESTFNQNTKRCEKILSYNSLKCEVGELKDGIPNYCQTKPILETPKYEGDIIKSWYMCDSCLTDSKKRNELLTSFKEIILAAGGTTANLTVSGNNYILNHNSKKVINLSLSSGGNVNVPAGASITIRNNGITVGGTSLTGVKPVLYMKASLSCENFSFVPQKGNYPAYTKCDNIPGKFAKCSEGYNIGYIDGDAVCFKIPSCPNDYKLSKDGMSCIKNLTCAIGHIPDYTKNSCVKVETGFEIDLNQSLYIKEFDCLGGISERGVCSFVSTCAREGQLETEIDKCVLLPDFSCPDDVTAKCAEGSYYKDGQCFALPECPLGTVYNFETKLCSSAAVCEEGFFLQDNKCVKGE